eukprot:3876106-Amphidinium_carterae.1
MTHCASLLASSNCRLPHRCDGFQLGTLAMQPLLCWMSLGLVVAMLAMQVDLHLPRSNKALLVCSTAYACTLSETWRSAVELTHTLSRVEASTKSAH